jgi:hypothetical protein
VGEPLSAGFAVVYHELYIARPGKPVRVPLELSRLTIEQVGGSLFRPTSDRSHLNSVESTVEERLRFPEIDDSSVQSEVVRNSGQTTGRSHNSEERTFQGKVEILGRRTNLPVSTTGGLKNKTRDKILETEHLHPFARGGPLINAS